MFFEKYRFRSAGVALLHRTSFVRVVPVLSSFPCSRAIDLLREEVFAPVHEGEIISCVSVFEMGKASSEWRGSQDGRQLLC